MAAREGLEWHEEFAALMAIWVDLLLKPHRVLAQAERHFKPATKFSKVDVPTHLVGTCAYTGDLERGVAVLADLTAELESQGQPTFGAGPQHLGRFLARYCDWFRSETLLGDALAWARKASDITHVAMVQTAHGELLLFREEYEQARQALEEATRLFRDGKAIGLLLDAIALEAQCLVAMDRLSEAERLIKESRSYLAASEDWGRLAAGIALSEALLLARQGWWLPAAERVNYALQTYRALLLRWDEAWTCFQWGSVAVTRGPVAQQAEALAALSTAYDLWSAMRAERFSRKAGRLLKTERVRPTG
jgi:tetratricopeptide (TPR) repeat protein